MACALAALGGNCLAAEAPRPATVHTFVGGDGTAPYAPLTLGANGIFYGVTSAGGTHGAGTVFLFDPKTGIQTVLYNLTGGADGGQPFTNLTLSPTGTFYGTTSRGGAANYGTIFTINPSTGAETTIYSFANTPDGAGPFSPLALAPSGMFYGTTAGGGTSGYGTVFSFDPNTRAEAVLHNFLLSNDGFGPIGNIVIDNAGTLYGTTEFGDINGALEGSIYSVNLATGAETVLYAFTGQSDGSNPYGGLVLGSNGDLYGTTQLGGSTQNGTAYRFILPTGQFAVLHHFTGNLHHGHGGEYPLSPLTLDPAGRTLYGTTYGNFDPNMEKPNAEGTVFAIDSASGATKNLALFNKPNGPWGGVALGPDGKLYGTTVGQGQAGDGTIFRVRP